MTRSSLVLVVDRLGAGFLGAYGNTWLETPEFNALASESLLLESAFADAPALDQIYRGYWSGLPAASNRIVAPTDGLASRLARADIPSELITDCLDVAEHPLASGFDELTVLPEVRATESAADAAQTQFATLLAAAIERLQDPTPRLIWLHANGLAAPWDAPLDFREQFRDEEDPPSPTGLGPPEFPVSANTDPDEVLGWVHAYAGQVAAFDACWGALFDAFRASPLQANALAIVTSPRGYPLGEHGWVGRAGDQLREELLHVPCLVRRGDAIGALARDALLTQPVDLHATLCEWFGLPPLDGASPQRSWLDLASREAFAERRPILAVGPGERAVRTSHWFFRRDSERDELYVKPDDRWEVNEVSRRCQPIVEAFDQLQSDLQKTLDQETAAPLPTGDDALWTDFE